MQQMYINENYLKIYTYCAPVQQLEKVFRDGIDFPKITKFLEEIIHEGLSQQA